MMTKKQKKLMSKRIRVKMTDGPNKGVLGWLMGRKGDEVMVFGEDPNQIFTDLNKNMEVLQ